MSQALDYDRCMPKTDPLGPSVLIIRLLEACNAGCFMCGFANSSDDFRFGLQETRELLDRLRGGPVRVVRFTGGEPLLMEDLTGIVAEISAEHLLTSVITNGWHLPERAIELADSGLSQVIVSLDAPDATRHDRYRRLPGLYDRLVAGVRTMSAERPLVRLRANTVVGPHNIDQLVDMWLLLEDLRVDQWSLIPIKRSDRAWSTRPPADFENALGELRSLVSEATGAGPDFVGPGLHFLGRSKDERVDVHRSGRNMTPSGSCLLVDHVRYYTPKDGMVYPCNCVPHRLGGQDLGETITPLSFSSDGVVEARTFLRAQGPSTCEGCEPANVALGEGRVDLEADPLGY